MHIEHGIENVVSLEYVLWCGSMVYLFTFSCTWRIALSTLLAWTIRCQYLVSFISFTVRIVVVQSRVCDAHRYLTSDLCEHQLLSVLFRASTGQVHHLDHLHHADPAAIFRLSTWFRSPLPNTRCETEPDTCTLMWWHVHLHFSPPVYVCASVCVCVCVWGGGGPFFSEQLWCGCDIARHYVAQ